MSFSDKTILTLEFDKICAMLADCAPTEGAREMAMRLMPSADVTEVLRRLRRTTDARHLCDVKGRPPFGSVKDVSAACERAAKGAMLSTRELLEIGRVLHAARLLVDYIQNNKPFETTLELDCITRDGLLLDVATTMSTARVRVKELYGKDLPGGRSSFVVRFEVKNVAELEAVRAKLMNIRDVVSTRRGQN